MHNPLQIFHDDPSPPTRPLCSSIAYSSNFRSHAHFHALWMGPPYYYLFIGLLNVSCLCACNVNVRFPPFDFLVCSYHGISWIIDDDDCCAHSYRPAGWIFPSLISFVFFFLLLPQFFSNYWYSIHPIFNSVSYYLIVNYDKS